MLIECPECKRRVSDRAHACPECGFPVSENLKETKKSKPSSTKKASSPKNQSGAKKASAAKTGGAPSRPDTSRLGKILNRKPPASSDSSFKATHPLFAKAWHTTKNKGVGPQDVFVEHDNTLAVWWKPPCGHVFQRQIKNWIQKPVCPECKKMPNALAAGRYGGRPAQQARKQPSGSPASRTPASKTPAQDPYEAQNAKVWRKRRGILRLQCPTCGFIFPVDFSLVDEIINQDSKLKAMGRFGDRQYKSGAMLTFNPLNRLVAEQMATRELLRQQALINGVTCPSCNTRLEFHTKNRFGKTTRST